jgi:hypothetical protein
MTGTVKTQLILTVYIYFLKVPLKWADLGKNNYDNNSDSILTVNFNRYF